MRKRLILFDIDGTLILDDGAAREAYAIGLETVYGYRESLRRYDFSGRTDPQITHMVLSDAGFERDVIDQKLDDLWRIYTSELEKRVSIERIHRLEGVESLLEILSSEPNVVVALLTGNIERGARIKLSPHALNRYFKFGAFGSDSADRQALPPIAVERARQHAGVEVSDRDVVVIGDSIYDVRCGAPHRSTTIAVCTGRTTRETLAAENPDYLFDSLQPSSELLDAILGD